MILEIIRRFLCGLRRRKTNAQDLARINAAANRLNREAEEVLEYQADDEVRSVDN